MPRLGADHLSPIEVRFGDVFESPTTSKPSVVVELHSDTTVYVAAIISDKPNQEILGGMGSAGREDITKVIGRWQLSTVQAALFRNHLFGSSSDSFKERFSAHLELESQKPPILLRR